MADNSFPRSAWECGIGRSASAFHGLKHGDVSYWQQPEFPALTAPYGDRDALKRSPHWRDEVIAPRERDFVVIDRVLAAAAKKQIAEHPRTYAWNLMFHVYAMWGRPAAWDVLDPGAARFVWLGGYAGFLGLAALGVWSALKEKPRNAPALSRLGFAAWSTLVILPIVTEPRYQASAGVFLTAFAGAGPARLWEAFQSSPTVINEVNRRRALDPRSGGR